VIPDADVQRARLSVHLHWPVRRNVCSKAQAFTRALSKPGRIVSTAAGLHLFSADGTTLATLTPQPMDVTGTSWQVTRINNGKHSVVSVVKDSDVAIEFAPDGRASGSARPRTSSAAAPRRAAAGTGRTPASWSCRRGASRSSRRRSERAVSWASRAPMPPASPGRRHGPRERRPCAARPTRREL
jgi:hypothetical protein